MLIVCTLPAQTMTSMSGLPAWFLHISGTQKGLGQQTAKKNPNYNPKTMISPTACCQWCQVCFQQAQTAVQTVHNASQFG